MAASPAPVLSVEAIGALAHRALVVNGFSDEHAVAIAQLVAAAERDGCPSHGLMRVPTYVSSVRSGRIDPRAVPSATEPTPSALRVDGGGGFSTLAVHRHVDRLTDMARAQGMAAMLVVNAHHLGALWYDVEPLAARGLVGVALVAARPVMSVFGSRAPVFGTNPLAFACPSPGAAPLVFDMASSAAARGEIMLAASEGRAIPETWAVDPAGRPTTDPARGLEGMLLPFGGGHKGSSIALMVELLAVLLGGGQFGFEAIAADRGDGGPLATGQTLLAFDPVRLGGGDPAARVGALVAHMTGAGVDRMPGARRLEARARHLAPGVPVNPALLERIAQLSRTP